MSGPNHNQADQAHTVHLSLSVVTVEAALSALDGAAGDEREPQRYRDWFARAAAEIREARGEVSS